MDCYNYVDLTPTIIIILLQIWTVLILQGMTRFYMQQMWLDLTTISALQVPGIPTQNSSVYSVFELISAQLHFCFRVT